MSNRPAMTYGIECWLIKKQRMHKMSVVDMRMLSGFVVKLGMIESEMSAFESI